MQKISNIHFANIHQAGGILASCSNKYWGLQLYYENDAEKRIRYNIGIWNMLKTRSCNCICQTQINQIWVLYHKRLFFREIIPNRGSWNYHFPKIWVLKNCSGCALAFFKWYFSKRKSACITLLGLSASLQFLRGMAKKYYTRIPERNLLFPRFSSQVLLFLCNSISQ